MKHKMRTRVTALAVVSVIALISACGKEPKKISFSCLTEPAQVGQQSEDCSKYARALKELGKKENSAPGSTTDLVHMLMADLELGADIAPVLKKLIDGLKENKFELSSVIAVMHRINLSGQKIDAETLDTLLKAALYGSNSDFWSMGQGTHSDSYHNLIQLFASNLIDPKVSEIVSRLLSSKITDDVLIALEFLRSFKSKLAEKKGKRNQYPLEELREYLDANPKIRNRLMVLAGSDDPNVWAIPTQLLDAADYPREYGVYYVPKE